MTRRDQPATGLKAAALAAGILLGAAIASCGEDPVQPPFAIGAGLRFEIPDSLRSLAGMRIELWHDNATPPPRCVEDQERKGPDALLLPFDFSPLQVDTCGGWSAEIRDFAGRPVRVEPDLPYTGRAYGWDQADDAGNPVPSGLYFTDQACTDPAGRFFFNGAYFIHRDRERLTSCRWPLWIEEPGALPEEGILEYGPFPLAAEWRILDVSGAPVETVPFTNPYLVRIVAPGRTPFEQAVTLVDREFTTIRVRLEPEPAGDGGQSTE